MEYIRNRCSKTRNRSRIHNYLRNIHRIGRINENQIAKQESNCNAGRVNGVSIDFVRYLFLFP